MVLLIVDQGRLLVERQREHESRSARFAVLGPDAAAMRLDDGAERLGVAASRAPDHVTQSSPFARRAIVGQPQ